eukprot:7497022-Heterocapsa_arctica.AAC.1
MQRVAQIPLRWVKPNCCVSAVREPLGELRVALVCPLEEHPWRIRVRWPRRWSYAYGCHGSRSICQSHRQKEQ